MTLFLIVNIKFHRSPWSEFQVQSSSKSSQLEAECCANHEKLPPDAEKAFPPAHSSAGQRCRVNKVSLPWGGGCHVTSWDELAAWLNGLKCPKCVYSITDVTNQRKRTSHNLLLWPHVTKWRGHLEPSSQNQHQRELIDWPSSNPCMQVAIFFYYYY